MGRIRQLNKFKDSIFIKYFVFIIMGLLGVAACVFLFLYTNYKEDFVIDLDGYMIGANTLEDLKAEEAELKNINIVKVKSNDTIYKNSFDKHVNGNRRKSVNVNYPLYVNDGLAIVNYNENVNLLNTDLKRSVGYKNLVLSYGKIYDGNDYTQIDEESYLFLSYEDGLFINLYDLKIETTLNTYEIPTNSIIYFMDDRINYFERKNNKFIRQTIKDVDYQSMLKFYYSGQEENYEYTYEKLLVGIGLLYVKEEIPKFEDLEEGEQITDIEKEEIIVPEGEDINNDDIIVPEGKKWKKPVVTSSELTPNVYTMSGQIKISDPAGVITKAPTYTMYVDNKVYSRRTFYGSGDIVISGLLSETNYYIVGQYTYLDSDFKTQKLVTFYMGTVTTKSRDSLEKIALNYELGKIYSKKIELNKVKITSSLNSEALHGVRKVALVVNGDSYNLNSKKVQSLLNGNEITIDTSESLASNSKINFEIVFYDRENNILLANGNKGSTRTSKKEPTVFLKLADTDTINVKISADLRNDDNVQLNNYHYTVTNSAGKVVATDVVDGKEFTIKDLDPNQIFILKVMADIDLDDNNGLIKEYVLGQMELSTLPISSLGFVHMKIAMDKVTKDSGVVKVALNKGKTDAILLSLLNKLTINLYKEETGELVATKYIEEDNIDKFKSAVNLDVLFTGLESNTKYLLEFKSLVKQGSTEYDLDCIYNLDNFETTKKPANVLIANSFTSNNMIDFDVMVDDEDGTILSEEVVIELRDEKKNIVKMDLIDINTDDYIRMTYNDLKPYHNYTLVFYANEYNETNINSEYKSKYELLSLDIFTEEGISGKIELISSLRKATGTNIADLHSEIKWVESYHSYTIPKTIDEDGDMHIYSKTGASSYSYDLNDYTGKLVTASFKIKAVSPVEDKYKLYFSNYLVGSADIKYGIELTNINTNNWKTFTYTFVPGYYYDANKQVYVKDSNEVYGKKRASFVGFYFNGGGPQLAEYEIKDFKIQVVNSNESEYEASEFELEQGQYNSAGKKSDNNFVRVADEIKFQGGYYYKLNFDVKHVRAYFFNSDGTLFKDCGWYEDGVIIYVPTDKTAKLMFKQADTAQYVDPNEVNFRMSKWNKNENLGSYEDFKYDLITKVRVNLVDLRNEITNRDYFIKVFEGEELVKEYNYQELIGIDRLTTIKEIDLAEHKNYRVELGIKIRDRYYSLSTFDVSTAGEVQGIENLNDWYYIQPRGNYILLNDLSFKDYREEKTGYNYRYFYGTIDFQGYTMSTYSIDGTNVLDKFSRIEKSAVLKNLVLDIHYQHELAYNYNWSSFVYDNYGTIENVIVNVYDETKNNLANTNFTTLVTNNRNTGKIENFVVNIVNKTNLYRNSAMLVYSNYGLIQDGYIYGADVEVDPEYKDGDPNLGMVFSSGSSRSTVNRVFVLPSLLFDDESQIVTGLIGEDTYGVVSNAYTLGKTNQNILANGPGVGTVRSTATLDKVYYLNDSIFNNSDHQKINATALNDIYFQESLFEGGFEVADMIKLGYFPQVKFSSEKMPQQEYIELPKVQEDNLVDIVSMKVLEQTNSSAVVEFNVSNPEGENITKISIADLDVNIIEQEFSDAKSIVKAELSNPDVYVSKYQIRSISSVNYLGYSNVRNYTLGEKYADVSFYHEIKDVDDWKKIQTGLNQNYALVNDLDLHGYTSDVFIGNFSGKIDGNNHTIKNGYIAKAGVVGLFNQMNGVLKNIVFENFEIAAQSSGSTYAGIVGSSNQYGRYDNVHVINTKVYNAENKTSDTFYAGALVGSASDARIQNCSSTDAKITSTAAINNVSLGGLVGYGAQMNITNSYAQNVEVNISNSISTYGAGGLVGRVAGSNGYVGSCYSTGNVTNNGAYTGGLIGYSAAVVEKNYSAVNVNSELDYAAGIIGYVSANADYVTNNLYVGNLYSLKETSKIALGIVVSPTNYSLSSSLVNGVKSDITNGESVVSYDDLLKNETYSDVIQLGEDFQYVDAEKAITPKLYYMGTEDLLDHQEDNMLYKDLFEIQEIVIDKHAEYANLVLYLKNPDNFIVTSVEIDDVDVSIIKNANENGLAVLEIKATPERFFDSYKLSKIIYKETEEGKEKVFEKNIKLEMMFYKYIRNYDDWQNISSEYAENYILMADIDFSSRKNVNTNIIVNRLETTSNDEYRTLSGIEITNTKNKNGVIIIQKVLGGMKNIIFEDVTITDTSTGNNKYINIIMFNYGDLENVKFKNITIDAPKKNYVGMIGENYGVKVENIELEGININAKETVGGFIAYPFNKDYIKYNNISATDVHIMTERGSVGGIFGNMPNSVASSVNTKTTTNISIKNSSIRATSAGVNYIGGIAGLGECSNCYVENVDVTGARYVGGISGSQKSAYDFDNRVVNARVNVSEFYGGGMYGQGRYTYDSNVDDSVITSLNDTTYGVGGFVGYKVSGYHARSCGVTNTTVTGNGTEHGGFIGRGTYSTIYSSYVQDSIVNGKSMVGGMAGTLIDGTYIYSTVTRTLVNATDSYAGGLVGLFGNTEGKHGSTKQTYVTDTDVRAGSFAGGFYGGLKYPIITYNNISQMLFEGSVEATENKDTSGLATGDQYNEMIARSFKMAFYEKSTVNKDKIYSINQNNISSINLLSDSEFISGKYIDTSTGKETSLYSYPNAAYTKDFIQLEKGKTYQLGLNSRTGKDSVDIAVYDKNNKFIKNLSVGTENLAYINHYDAANANKLVFTAVENIKIKVSFYYFDELEYYYLSELNTGATGIRTNQLLSYDDLRNRATWTRYLDNNTFDYYYYYSKLVFDQNYFDFSPLNYRIPEINLVDKSENKSNLKISASAINKNGIMLDGKTDEGVITGYNPGTAFTISAKLTDISNTDSTYQFFFSTEDFNSSSNGFGAFIHNRKVYARIAGSNSTCDFYLMRETPTEVTISYNGVDTVKFYKNGELFATNTLRRTINHLPSAKTMISPSYNDGTNLRKFDGIIGYLKVFDRALSDEEIRSNYNNSGVTNTEGLDLYYDFTEVKYQSNDGYYPTVYDYSINTAAKDQVLTQLPDDNNREYIKESNDSSSVTYKKLVDDKLDNIYNIYPSSINTINLEFDDDYTDLSFSYKNGDYQSEIVKVSDRVYSLSYDFVNDLEITISSSNDSKSYKYNSDKFRRNIKVIDNDYYHISDGSLYKNDKKLIDDAIHIYNNLVLLKSGKVYDINIKKEVNVILPSGVLANAIPLYDFTSDDSVVRTFYSFSEVTNDEGTTMRDGQIMIRDKNMFVFDSNENSKNDMNIFDVYNNSLYQISLRDNSLISLMSKLKYPSYFMNSDISEVSFDINGEEPIMLIRYNNGYIYAFNYYTGDELFEYGSKVKTTLFRFIFDSLSDDATLSISNDSYDDSSALINSLIEVKDNKVKEKLNINIGGESVDKDNNKDDVSIGEETESNKAVNKSEVISKYIQVYNYDTDTYEVYNTNDLLNPVNKEVVSERIKIKSDSFLYNYFYDNKINRLLDGSKLLIYGVIIVLVLVNLVIFGKYLGTRGVKNHD